MDVKYQEYLNSEAWQKKRLQRLSISKFKCAACNVGGCLEVHHLTYARIFNEDMADLLPLCPRHHEMAERQVKYGNLPRSEDVLFLATETIRLLLKSDAEQLRRAAQSEGRKNEFRRRSEYGLKVRNPVQEQLSQDPWFISVLMEENRGVAKKLIRARFERHPQRGLFIANSFTLWDRHKASGFRISTDCNSLPSC